MADVFISYSYEDRSRVMAITRELAALGVTAWTDQDIRAGEDWMDAIETALRDAKVMVLFITPQFLASDWCQMEIGVALSREKAGKGRMMSILLSDALHSSLLTRFQTLDARELPAQTIAAKIKCALEMNT